MSGGGVTDSVFEDGFKAIIRPNCSMSPRGLVTFVICLTVVSLSIALSFLSLGLWMVLPFAGLETIIVAVAIAASVRRASDYEMLIVDGDEVTITQNRGGRTRTSRFQRYWTQVRHEPGATRLQPDRLLIGSHGRFVAIGEDLTEADKKRFAARISTVLRVG
jgi:uncharacterized membrane protein